MGVWEALFGAPRYRGPASDHFDGAQFHNIPSSKHSFFGLLRWLSRRSLGEWPDWIDANPGPKPPDKVGPGELRITFVNHATLLIQMDGLNLLTDPVYSERTSPVTWAGPKRCRAPGITMADLPKLDAILLSHNHYDHLDLSTLAQLSELQGRLKIYTGLGNAALLQSHGHEAFDMDWWDSCELGPLSIHAVPAQHFSGRSLLDRDQTLWLGFVVDSPSGAVFFAGDTAYGPHFRAIAGRFPKLRLALLPIGGYKPRWFMEPVHMDPAEAVKAHEDLGAAQSVAIHFGTFPLSDEGEKESVADLQAALDKAQPDNPFWVLDFGEGRAVPALTSSESQAPA